VDGNVEVCDLLSGCKSGAIGPNSNGSSMGSNMP
jgi:hypothetical protein